MKVDLDKLQEYVDKRLISERPHPTLPLLIFNYTNKTQYEGAWDKYTMLARGLITDHSGNIIGRGFSKFFSPEQHEVIDLPPLLWDAPYTITEKADGVLFEVCTYNNQLVTATRGSFESEYVPIGNAILQERFSDFIFDPAKTYCFELISPESQIVVDYKGKRDLVLLAIIDNETGLDNFEDMRELLFLLSDVFTTPKVYPSSTSSNELRSLVPNDGSVEGLVIKFSDGQRAKIKTVEYMRLHRIMTNTNTITIWEYMAVEAIRKLWNDDPKWIGQCLGLDKNEVQSMLESKNTLDKLLDRVPDEFFNFIQQTRKVLQREYDLIENRASVLSNEGYSKVGIEKKLLAIEFAKLDAPYQGICINMMNDKPYQHLIWKFIRPKYGKPFVEDQI